MGRAQIRKLPERDELLRVLSYDHESGELRWRDRNDPGFNSASLSGKVAGHLARDGYVRLYMRGVSYTAHRVIWKMVTGDEPPQYVDHIDGNKSNNKWDNLRLASHAENKQNSTTPKSNRSGVKGVCWIARRRKWQAVVSANGKSEWLGRFNSKDDAAAAVERARDKLHGEFACHA